LRRAKQYQPEYTAGRDGFAAYVEIAEPRNNTAMPLKPFSHVASYAMHRFSIVDQIFVVVGPKRCELDHHHIETWEHVDSLSHPASGEEAAFFTSRIDPILIPISGRVF
jgi:hypothetical protein